MPWCLPFRTSFGFYVYDSVTNAIISITPDLYRILLEAHSAEKWELAWADAPDEVRSELSFLNGAGYLNESPLKKIENPLTSGIESMLERQAGMLILQVTQRCNFRCKYCIYSEENLLNRCHSDLEMSLETAYKAVDFYYQHSVDCDEIGISFYGGEPLLSFELIQRVVDYAERLFAGKRVTFRLTTNASLLDEEKVRYFTTEKHNFNVLISLDGPKEIQDMARQFPDGSGTYDHIMQRLHKIPDICSSYSSIFSFNSVIDTNNEYSTIAKIDQDPFVKECSVQYNFVEKEDRGTKYNSDFIESINYDIFLGYLGYYREKSPVYPNKLIEYLMKRNRMQEERIASGSLGERSAPSGPCAPGAHRLFVDYRGRLFPCERVSESNPHMTIGDIWNGFDLSSVRSMLNIASTTQAECMSCWAFQLCSLCIKASDEKGRLSSRARVEMCDQVRLNAMDLVGRMTLDSENNKHERRAAHYFCV